MLRLSKLTESPKALKFLPSGRIRATRSTETYHRRPSAGSAFHSSERIEEVTQVLGDCSAPGQVFIRDRGRAHRNDDRPDILMLPELSRIGPLRLHQSVPLSSGVQPFLSLAYGRHGCSPVLEGSITQDAPSCCTAAQGLNES